LETQIIAIEEEVALRIECAAVWSADEAANGQEHRSAPRSRRGARGGERWESGTRG
jgi:hypothetical protein